ncbi:MAG: phosphatidate cytidylyltransferase [Oligoflexia bacterium]|nr:phosphatidate cytidylyltransferase [Oligoflexia bacterium]MBF0364402.1 phosphatidate cytidylyltransferase [Oligoflexia bacterium]
MTNTQKRIISAIVLTFVVAISIYLGKLACFFLILLVGPLVADEIYTNFFKLPRGGPSYWFTLNMVVLPSLFVLIGDYVIDHEVLSGITLLHQASLLAVAINVLCIFFLFLYPMERSLEQKIPAFLMWPIGIVIFLLLSPIYLILFCDESVVLLIMLLLITYSMDTGAWFFGRKYGKHKLWEKVSPKKTVEGLIGGMLTSGVVVSLVWAILDYFDSGFAATVRDQGGVVAMHGEFVYRVTLFVMFMLLSLISQIGDLFQSKLKRLVNLKDSSQLIPGHGGVYDRVDSLIFVAPFYYLFLRYLLKITC